MLGLELLVWFLGLASKNYEIFRDNNAVAFFLVADI